MIGKTRYSKKTINGVEWLTTRPFKDKQGNWHKGLMLLNNFVSADTETANNHKDAKELSTWVSSIQVKFGDEEHLFREPWELNTWLMSLYDKYDLYETNAYEKRLLIFFHNLSYDAGYLIPFLRQLPGNPNNEDIGIYRGPNDILMWKWGALEFRCTKYLSGMSLEKWAKELNCKHQKKVGLYDYDKIHYQDDEFDENETIYSMEDVRVLDECIRTQMIKYGDDLMTLPYTATGYIRRVLQDSCLNDKKYMKEVFAATRLSNDLYIACREAYSGGYTHCNRFYSGLLLEKDNTYSLRFLTDRYHYENIEMYIPCIGHGDFRSHYPSQMTCYKFPIKPFVSVYDRFINDEEITFDDIIDMSEGDKYSTLTYVELYSAELKDLRITMPYMQVSKMFDYYIDKDHDAMADNGRILWTGKDQVWEMKLTDLDLRILNKQYNMEYKVLKVWRAQNDYLPACIVNVLDNYFKGKSEKKDVVKQCEELYGEFDERTLDAAYRLLQDKKGLNGIYGCTAEDPIKEEFTLTNLMISERVVHFKEDGAYNEKFIEDSLDDFYNNPKKCLPYQIGVWVTARARYELFEYIEEIGYDHVLYCDTDSIFYIDDDQAREAIARLNARKQLTAHFVTLSNGKKVYYDVFESELPCAAFKGLHSKTYGVVIDEFTDKNGEYHPQQMKVTIAGVIDRTLVSMDGDKPVYITREQELAKGETDPFKALDNLEDGFSFTINAGLTCKYSGPLGASSDREIMEIEIDGHKIVTAGGPVLQKLQEKKIKHYYDDIDYEVSNMFD